MVVAIDAGEFEGQLVLGRELPPAGEIAAEQGVGPGADDELVGRIVAAAADDRALHGGQDLGFVDAGRGETMGLVERQVGELGGAPDIGDLGRAFHQAQAAHQVRGVGEIAESVERGFQALAVARRQAIGLVFDAQAFAAAALLLENLPQCQRRIGVGQIDPDADVLDHRCVLGLEPVRHPGQQDHPAVGAEIEALEEHVAEACRSPSGSTCSPGGT